MAIYFLHSMSRQTIISVPHIFLSFHIYVFPFIMGNYIRFDSICLGPEISYNKESFHSILQTTVISVCKTSLNIQKLCIESKQQMHACVFYIIPAIHITVRLVLVTDT